MTSFISLIESEDSVGLEGLLERVMAFKIDRVLEEQKKELAKDILAEVLHPQSGFTPNDLSNAVRLSNKLATTQTHSDPAQQHQLQAVIGNLAKIGLKYRAGQKGEPQHLITDKSGKLLASNDSLEDAIQNAHQERLRREADSK